MEGADFFVGSWTHVVGACGLGGSGCVYFSKKTKDKDNAIEKTGIMPFQLLSADAIGSITLGDQQVTRKGQK